MSVLVKSFQVLQDDIRRINGSALAADSIKALASIADILKISPIPETTFTKLTLILRSRMLPLYRIALKSALRYAAEILAAISDIKLQNPDDVKQREFCDNAQKSLLSGVLDHLEQHQTNENQALVASMLYPFLCLEFFPPQNNTITDTQDSLFCTVFQVLSESAISHPGNQHRLRDPNVLGSKRLGAMLRGCKDFVALEALLELVGNIIPSGTKTERRSKFIQEVFDSTQFACSLEIVQLLERASSTGWDATSAKICDALAKSDSTYPQPFETTQIRVQKTSYTVSRIYADKSAFIASVDEDGQFETFRLPFLAIKRIEVSAPSAFMATVTVSVSSSPLLGHSPIIRDKTDDMSIAFDLRKENIRDFATISRKRGLKCHMISIHEKQSKAEKNVELSFDSGNNINPPRLEEKIENITKLWESSRSPADENTATSPLCIPSGAISKKAESKPNKLQLDAIFGASDEELSEISDLEIANRRVQLIEARKVRRVKSKRAASPFSNAETRMAKIKGVGTMDGVESSGVFELTHEAGDRQSKEHVTFATNRLVSQSFHHQSYYASPEKSTSDARPNRNSRRHVRKNIIVSIESVTGDTRFATSERMTSSMLGMPPLRGGVSPIEATGTPILDAGTTASPDMYHTREVFEIAPPLDLVVQPDIEVTEATRSNDKHAQDVNDILSPSRPKVCTSHLNEANVYASATSDNRSSSGKNSTRGISHMPIDLGEQSKSELITPKLRTVDADAQTFIDLTGDNSKDADDGPGELLQERSTKARAIRPTEQIEVAKKAKKVMFTMEAPNNTIRGTLLQQPIAGEDVTPIHVTGSSVQEMANPRTSISFILPPPVNEDTVTTENKRARIIFTRSRDKGHPVDIQSQSYSDRPGTEVDIIPRIAKVIGEIHEVVVDNTARRFGDVRKDIRETRVKILEGAAKEMQAMQHESAQHYNGMVDLANNYADHERKMVHALSQLVNSERDMVQGIKEIIQTHDRFSLSTKFPRTILPTAPAPFNVNSIV